MHGWRGAMDAQLAHLDALVLPTTPIVAPTIAEMKDTETFNTNNMLLLRNSVAWNFFDMCAISLPLPGVGAAGRADAGRAQRA